MNYHQRLLTLAATLFIASATLTHAQDNTDEGSFPIVDEPLTLTLMGARAPIQGDWENLKVFRRLAELTNLNFTFITPPIDGYNERKNLTFASGQLPDLFFGGELDPSDEVTYGNQGLLVPLEELIAEHAPNFSALLGERPEIRQSITTPDGHIYTLPNVTIGFGLYPKLWINQSWLDTLGLEMPETTEDLYDVLVAFKEGDPNGNGQADEIPLTASTLDDYPLGDIRPAMLAAFGFATDYGPAFFDVEDDTVRFIPTHENFRVYLEYMNRLYSEELLDPDVFVQNRQQISAKGLEGRLGAFNHAGPFLVVGPEENNNYPQLMPLTSEVNSERIWPELSNVNRGTFAITNSNPNPEATLRWADYFYGEEGALLLVYGIEGEDWQRTPAGGLERIVPEGMNQEEYRGGQVTPDAGTSLPLNREPVFALSQVGIEETNPLNAFIGQQTNEKLIPYATPVFPLVYFSNDEQAELNTLLTDIESFVQQSEARFISGQQPLGGWEGYVSTLERIGAPRVLEIYQAAYDRWLEASAE